MPIKHDRVRETTTTSGTGTVTLAGAVAGYQAFATVFPSDANEVIYAIVDGTAWETGLGVYTTSSTTLSRDIVYESSSGGSHIALSGGTAFVFMDLAANAVVDMGKTAAVAAAVLMQ